MQAWSAEPGGARHCSSPGRLRSAEAGNPSLDVGCLVRSGTNGRRTSHGPANGAATALKPEPAPCEMVQVASTRLCRTQGSSGRVVPSRRAVPQAGRASPHACGARHCPSVRAMPVPCSSALLLPAVGNSPCVTAWQPRLPFQPQPARRIRSFDSSCLYFCRRGVGLGSAAKNEACDLARVRQSPGFLPSPEQQAKGLPCFSSFPRNVLRVPLD